MTTRIVAAGVLLLVLSARGEGQSTGQPPGQIATFRASRVVVTVDVSIRRGNTPITGLAAEDFEILDNGVRQQIETLAVEDVPIDITLAVDTSGSVIKDLEAFKTEVRRFVKLLRPVDRVRLIAIATGVDELVPMGPAQGEIDLSGLKPGGFTSSNDGLFYALLWPAEVDRRHLVIALTDGIDTQSTLGSESVVDVATRARAVFHVVLVDGLGSFMTTWQKGARDAVADAAVKSGGAVHSLERASTDFKRIFDDFRASYVLRYSPEGVAREGWHAIKVNVKRPDASRLTIRAKPGYWGEK